MVGSSVRLLRRDKWFRNVEVCVNIVGSFKLENAMAEEKSKKAEKPGRG